MESFVILRHPATTLVTTFNNPDKPTNDLHIFKLIDNKQIITKSLQLKEQGFITKKDQVNLQSNHTTTTKTSPNLIHKNIDKAIFIL